MSTETPTPISTATAARVFKSASAHWYRLDGTACHEVPKADGKGMRKTTLADARKQNLLPSVTTVIKLLHREALVNWMIEQACLAIATSPRNEGEAIDAFVYRVLHVEQQQEQEGQIARDLGTKIHDACESYFHGQPIADDMKPYVMPAIEGILAYGERVSSEVVLIGDDYGGVTDLIQDAEQCWWLWDIKSTKNLPDPKKGGAYPEHRLQLSAYAKAFQQRLIRAGEGLKPIQTGNVYISSKEPGKFIICPHNDQSWEETYERGFAPLVRHWQWSNGYRPENPNREEEADGLELIGELQQDLAVAKAELDQARQQLAKAKAPAPVPATPLLQTAPVPKAANALPTQSKDGRKVQWSVASAAPTTRQ